MTTNPDVIDHTFYEQAITGAIDWAESPRYSYDAEKNVMKCTVKLKSGPTVIGSAKGGHSPRTETLAFEDAKDLIGMLFA